LDQKGYKFSTNAEIEIVKDIKEKMCYVVGNYEFAKSNSEDTHSCEKNYELPDGRKILIGSERFRATEILFTPSEGDFNLQGVHKYCFDSVQKCDVDVRKDLFQNIILSGGSTLFDGMGERMWHEIH
jgi:actin